MTESVSLNVVRALRLRKNLAEAESHVLNLRDILSDAIHELTPDEKYKYGLRTLE